MLCNEQMQNEPKTSQNPGGKAKGQGLVAGFGS